MQIYEILWKERFIEKIESKHDVSVEEVENIIFSDGHFRKAQRGRIKGEDLYAVYGQTEGGRYLIVFFIYKKQRKAALPISAREMSVAERRYYEQKK